MAPSSVRRSVPSDEMSRSRILTQGALAIALMLAGITTVFVRADGGSDVASAPTTPAPSVTAPAPTTSASIRVPAPEPEPAPPAMRPKVKPRAPLSRQEATAPAGERQIVGHEEHVARAEPEPATCKSFELAALRSLDAPCAVSAPDVAGISLG